jgi:predicted DNA-binding transcriptional regulator AlpA
MSRQPATNEGKMTSMLSVPAFCADHGLSRSLFYRLIKEGRGPRLTKIARRTLISAEAAAEWRARMERETSQAERLPKVAKECRRRTEPVSCREAA